MPIISFFVIFLFLILPKETLAESNFNIDENVEYKVHETGNTFVTHTVTIKNNSTYEYAKRYHLELSNINPKNIKAFENGSYIPLEHKTLDEKTSIEINFDKPVTGKGNTRTFILTYEEPGLARLNGDVWEISVPRIIESRGIYKIILTVPAVFGDEAILYPEAKEKKENNDNLVYIFDGKDIEKSGINAVFGKFQVYSLKLLYHLDNTKNEKDTFEIAIPPDTSTQRAFYTNITPEPQDVDVDEDGNWLAKYVLNPKKNEDIVVEGYVQVFANPVKILTPYPSTILSNLKTQLYWEVEENQIKEIAKHLKSSEEVFNFVTDNLSYNYDRITPEVERLGAKKALSASNNAICTEFTDLFIALSRASGIPAREINGYAYSENPNLQPLSLISDVLHAWPEYWNDIQKNWIPVDPTWSATSGINYFDKFDLNHVSFVIHGKSSTHPYPAGSYKNGNLSKDVNVNFSSLPKIIEKPLTINYYFRRNVNFLRKKLVIKIENHNATAYYDLIPIVSYRGSETEYDKIPALPPYGWHEIEVELPTGPFAINTPDSIKVSVDSTQKDIFINKTVFVTQQLLFFLSLLLIIVIYAGLKTKKINPEKIRRIIRYGFKKFFKYKKASI